MLALGLVLNIVGVGLLCWLIVTLAVYAVPFFVAINAGILAFHSGASSARQFLPSPPVARPLPSLKSRSH